MVGHSLNCEVTIQEFVSVFISWFASWNVSRHFKKISRTDTWTSVISLVVGKGRSIGYPVFASVLGGTQGPLGEGTGPEEGAKYCSLGTKHWAGEGRALVLRPSRLQLECLTQQQTTKRWAKDSNAHISREDRSVTRVQHH